jgi:hypothetical protein
MTKGELLGLVRRLYALKDTEEEEGAMMNRMHEAFPNADIGTLMYWTTPGLSPEQIVEEVFRRESEHVRGLGSSANEP